MPDSGKGDAMFDLEKAVAEWRGQMMAGGIKEIEVLDELESHLRDDIEQRARQGLSVEAAFAAAVEALGRSRPLEQEFAKLRRPSRKQPAPVLCVRAGCWGSVAFVCIVGGWAVAQTKVSAASALQLTSALIAVLYFSKLPFLFQRLPALRSPVRRECIRFLSILAWPAWVYSVAPAGTALHLILLAFGSIIPAIVLAASFRLDEELAASVLSAIIGNLDEAATLSLQGAQSEATRLNHDFVGTEHLLLGLLRAKGSTVAKIMKNRGVTAQTVAAAIEREICLGRPGPVPQSLPQTPRVNRALKIAASEARATNRQAITTEHLLLGLLLEGTGVAARVLARLGVDADQVRREIEHL